jgi:hypothetical protein
MTTTALPAAADSSSSGSSGSSGETVIIAIITAIAVVFVVVVATVLWEYPPPSITSCEFVHTPTIFVFYTHWLMRYFCCVPHRPHRYVRKSPTGTAATLENAAYEIPTFRREPADLPPPDLPPRMLRVATVPKDDQYEEPGPIYDVASDEGEYVTTQ